MWIATVNGVSLYTEKDNFKRIPIQFENKNIQQLIEDKAGRIFLKTMSQLYVYNPETEEIDRSVINPDPQHIFYMNCHIDVENNLWISTSIGLLCYNPSNLQLKDSIPIEGYPYCSYLHNNELWLTGNHTIIISCLHRQVDVFLLWLDEDKVDKIFGNLMSNALKFTPEGGKIAVYFDVVTRNEVAELFQLSEKDKDTQYIKISVANTGQDIPEDKKEKIFERYYQVENQTEGRYNWGTGIGLYYARSLAGLHHGYIKAGTLEEGCGAVFTFIVPVNSISYTEEERATEQFSQHDAFPLAEKEYHLSSEQEEQPDKMKTILVVDDDTEVSHYLKTLLSPHYRVISRFNANSALKAINEELPDLVLSDVVMPDKTGYQLCREIKDDLQLCHIPVILVTAKATVKNQIEGLNTGADAYVTKPFEPSYLLALIKSQLKNREKVRSLLGKATQTDNIEEHILSPQDNAFMTDLYRLMESELSNPELDIARMTELMKISRTKFYYKVKGLTGENPSIFFKTYKLNRAAELITERKYTVSEIADMAGFNTLSHFSRSFKKQFGVTPSEYHR